jgi:hypothetical protein
MYEQRGFVLHVQEGTQQGSIAWSKNPASQVSAHFYVARNGDIAQLVDTDTVAWTQANGNGRWISSENEGYHYEDLTSEQVEANAQLFARGVREYGWPMVSTDTPSGYGIGWHGMGGAAWGGHYDCPGELIKARRPTILSRANEILTGTPQEDDVTQVLVFKDTTGQMWRLSGDMLWRERITPTALQHMQYWSNPANGLLTQLTVVDITGKAPVDLTDPDAAVALGVDVATLVGGGGGSGGFVPHNHAASIDTGTPV